MYSVEFNAVTDRQTDMETMERERTGSTGRRQTPRLTLVLSVRFTRCLQVASEIPALIYIYVHILPCIEWYSVTFYFHILYSKPKHYYLNSMHVRNKKITCFC